MNIKFYAPFLLIFISYLPFSFIALKMLGVKDRVVKRSLAFGSSFAFLHVGLPILGLYLAKETGAVIGGLLGFPLSILYISKVLNVKWWKNLLIAISVPVLSALVMGTLLMLFFKSIA